MSAVLSAVLNEADCPEPIVRVNIYAVIHKALRAYMCDTLLRVGRMDAGDDCERAEAIEQLRGLLALCTKHLHHENDHVHPAMERAQPHASSVTVDDHRHHEAAIAALQAQANAFESAPPAQRSVLMHKLYLHLSSFVAENFTHMVVEEVDNNAVLHAAYSDKEILAIEHVIVRSQSPAEAFAALSWMIPNVNADERATLLAGIQQSAPPQVFQGVLQLARERLSQRDFYKLESVLAKSAA